MKAYWSRGEDCGWVQASDGRMVQVFLVPRPMPARGGDIWNAKARLNCFLHRYERDLLIDKLFCTEDGPELIRDIADSATAHGGNLTIEYPA